MNVPGRVLVIQQDDFCRMLIGYHTLLTWGSPSDWRDFLRAGQKSPVRSLSPTPPSMSPFSFVDVRLPSVFLDPRCFCLFLISYPSQVSLLMNLSPIGFSWYLLQGELDWKPPTMIFHLFFLLISYYVTHSVVFIYLAHRLSHLSLESKLHEGKEWFVLCCIPNP